MKLLWYLVALLLGVFGTLGMLRALERMTFGGGEGPIVLQLLVGVVALLFAWRCLKRAQQGPASARG